ncbi:30S ribosomal protein S9 [Candidatus Gracilibacteria bacterium]|nr:30S ribosomal protein S9 [Candidatus Gracilibacteria bacterium]
MKTVKKIKIVDRKESKDMHSLYSGKYYNATGKRKSSIARIRMYEKGKGEIIVNGLSVEKYFQSVVHLLELIKSSLVQTGKVKDFNFTVKVKGGGMFSQADAVRHGIARALLVSDESLKSILKKEDQITRDDRTKERQKPGLKRARKASTWVKR